MLSIIQAAGWPIWPLLACSILALALIIERFISLKAAKVAPPRLLDEALQVSRVSVPAPDVVRQLERLGRWYGHTHTFTLPPAPKDGTLKTAVLLQERGGGPILAVWQR